MKKILSTARLALAASAVAMFGLPMAASAQGGTAQPNYGTMDYGVCRGHDPSCYHNWNAVRQNKILVYTRTAGPRHANLGPALAEGLNPPLVAANIVQNTMIKWGAELGLGVDYTEDVTQLANLSKYKAVLFISTSRDALWNNAPTTQNDAARTYLKQYIRSGGGFIAMHNAFGTEYNWPYYEGLLGNANYYDHGRAQNGTVIKQAPDPITAGLPQSFTLYGDEWYNLIPFPTNVKFLMTVDEKSLAGGTSGVAGEHPGHGAFHPVAWCQYFDGGKVFATTLGHDGMLFTDGSGVPGQVQYKQMIENAILAVTGAIPFCT
jgi:type 1 glutamine amidotransferase